jgi:hypothetical protein
LVYALSFLPISSTQIARDSGISLFNTLILGCGMKEGSSIQHSLGNLMWRGSRSRINRK